MINFLKKLFAFKKLKHPEDYYDVTITDNFIRVEHPKFPVEQIEWHDITKIKLINTDKGPAAPDIWLVLLNDNRKGCMIPHGAKGFEKVYDIVSQYDGFNFENFIASMSCTENAHFDLWTKK